MNIEDLLLNIKKTFNFQVNQNQLRIISRLIFEISRRENIPETEIIRILKAHPEINNISGRDKFFGLKKVLTEWRFPLSSKKQKIEANSLFLNKLGQPIDANWKPKSKFKPLKILVEKEVRNSFLVDNFRKKFPKVAIEEIKQTSDYLKNHKFTVSELKKPFVFIVKEKWDFLKPCPCTKNHLGCGYWIFNLGFGCPFDCSYCFLQHYTNFPGITLPGNLDDFFEKFDSFYKKLKNPIRIGTGEFCDSLALDEITEYSKKLIPYFKNKNVLFELKTKSASIKNLLKLESSPNIIISWSLNPSDLIVSEEIATASLVQRLAAVEKVKQAGYGLAFHFDPIIHYPSWEKSYQSLIKALYTQLKPPFAWISLGTLRSNRQLKTISELRFPKSNVFYGELFVGDDKKLRYPKFLRTEIYQKMAGWIRNYDQKTPLYLCMESKDIWKSLGEFDSSKKVEKYLLGL
ncbi:MAG: radical SAM protein [Candidatus Omnitrophica bacterium]|nr:radical SAM protein [Candidatus Omnitrophota bacterium]